MFLLPPLTHATAYENGGNVDQFFGSYTETIPISVPPFHGIEPKLSVTYKSAAGNGLLSVGWSLQGLSEIELIDHDYEMDGQWLISCGQQTDVLHGPDACGPRSPSCADALGWYSTLSESHLRIGPWGTAQFPGGVATERHQDRLPPRRTLERMMVVVPALCMGTKAESSCIEPFDQRVGRPETERRR